MGSHRVGHDWATKRRFLCPWDSPGKNIGVGSHFLLQGIFWTQESNPGLLHCRQILYHLSWGLKPGLSDSEVRALPLHYTYFGKALRHFRCIQRHKLKITHEKKEATVAVLRNREGNIWGGLALGLGVVYSGVGRITFYTVHLYSRFSFVCCIPQFFTKAKTHVYEICIHKTICRAAFLLNKLLEHNQYQLPIFNKLIKKIFFNLFIWLHQVLVVACGI